MRSFSRQQRQISCQQTIIRIGLPSFSPPNITRHSSIMPLWKDLQMWICCRIALQTTFGFHHFLKTSQRIHIVLEMKAIFNRLALGNSLEPFTSIKAQNWLIQSGIGTLSAIFSQARVDLSFQSWALQHSSWAATNNSSSVPRWCKSFTVTRAQQTSAHHL